MASSVLVFKIFNANTSFIISGKILKTGSNSKLNKFLILQTSIWDFMIPFEKRNSFANDKKCKP